MKPLPAQDLRSNRGTWAATTESLPTLAVWMQDQANREKYDPTFQGQKLATTYFDTAAFALRKNRRIHDKYITVRLRCYENNVETYAVSAKTEKEKFRIEVSAGLASSLLIGGQDATIILGMVLPTHLIVRLLEVSHEEAVQPVVTVTSHRYAVENPTDRYTLDLNVQTDTGGCLPYHVLEYKSIEEATTSGPASMNLRPIKLSKFLWATGGMTR